MGTTKTKDLKKRLNPQQREAVETIDGPLLIIAGAGSGKTGVITARIAEMLRRGVDPIQILALTFTNKAAREMVERIRDLTGEKHPGMTVSTFHAFGARLMAERPNRWGYRPRFSIYDTSDKAACLKEAIRELRLPHEAGEIPVIGGLFSDIKTRRTPWNEATAAHRPLFREYQELMTLHNAVDFDDLIIKPLEMFEAGGEGLDEYQDRYRYVMVDEFQDTSAVQYGLVRHLAQGHRNICCVGDDDQSIYSWRGAHYGNILAFETDFPELKEIKLERNYRSTGTILKAANAVISNNAHRKLKELWTIDAEEERTIQYAVCEDDQAEGAFIADAVGTLRTKEQIPYNEIAVLARTNALTKNIEESLLSRNIPYVMSGGTGFFQRQEIKDLVAYLKLIDNPDDDVSFLRVVNTPRRGIGKTTLERLVALAREKGYSLYSAMTGLVFGETAGLGEKARSAMADFVDLIEKHRDGFSTEGTTLSIGFHNLLDDVDYWSHLVQEFRHNEKIAKWRYENIQTFGDFLDRWERNPDNLEPTLTRWLSRITLVSRDEIEEGEDGKVNVMTIHASKGLEFDAVFIAGVDDGIIPNARSLEEDPGALEEERRLFYVALTRAKKNLYLTSCGTRKIRQETVVCVPSPFLEEIPEKYRAPVVTEDPVESPEEAADYFSRLPWK